MDLLLHFNVTKNLWFKGPRGRSSSRAENSSLKMELLALGPWLKPYPITNDFARLKPGASTPRASAPALSPSRASTLPAKLRSSAYTSRVFTLRQGACFAALTANATLPCQKWIF